MHVDGGLLEATDAELFTIDIFGLDQAVAVADEERIARHGNHTFFVAGFLHHTKHHAALIEMQS